MSGLLKKEIEEVKKWQGPRLSGRVTHVIGLLIESLGPEVSVGEICQVYGKGGQAIPCQVVGLKEQKVLLMPLAELSPISAGAEVYPSQEVPRVAVATSLCGRIIDAMGQPMDGKGELYPEAFYPVVSPPPAPLSRKPITEFLSTQVKAIDALCTLGYGQRMGIFSPPGGGKSTLMGMIARYATADINVIALIGERGREVKEFIERDLGPEGLARSVVVVVTSDQPALLRSKGANVAMAIAEYFRDQGKRVMLMMDSISRYAMALREIGLAVGEPPAIRGYTPSVFAALPRLLERAGNSAHGSITGIYTILAEEDPIPEQMRSLLDGHIYLSRELGEAGHFPPVDILKSLSRLMPSLVTSKQQKLARDFRKLFHTYQEAQELINIGAYVSGSNPTIDEALAKKQAMDTFLRQTPQEHHSFQETLLHLEEALA